jgi:hypothetical protein
MQLNDLVLLLYKAHDSFTTLDIEWSYQYDVKMMGVALQRYEAMESPGSVAMLTVTDSSAATVAQPQTHHSHQHLWWQQPDSVRLEQGVSTIINYKGNVWGYYPRGSLLQTSLLPLEQWSRPGLTVRYIDPDQTADPLQGYSLLDPSFLLATHLLEIIGETTYLDRMAVQVRATYRKNRESIVEEFFWCTADHYNLIVDKERGILLRYAGVIDGVEYAVSEVQQIAFDEPIPPETFIFTLP